MTAEAPYISVALCTHNHADRLVKTLSNLQSVQAPERAWEFLVIDNGCTDGTTELLAAYKWALPGAMVRVVREDKLGLSNARNRALQEARGQYLVFMDDDETPDPEWLVHYERAMLEHQPDALGGRIEVMFEDGDRPSWLQDELLGFLGKLDHGASRWLTSSETPIFGGNFAFRRSVFDRIGDFDARLGRMGTVNTGGEDTEIYQRLLAHGCSVRWVPEAIINHRIQTPKLRRAYFLDLHFRQGRWQGARKRGDGSRLPPKYLIPQVARAYGKALGIRLSKGADHSLRQEMNAAYFSGYVLGWMRDGV